MSERAVVDYLDHIVAAIERIERAGSSEQVVEPGFRSWFDRLTTNGIRALSVRPEPVEG